VKRTIPAVVISGFAVILIWGIALAVESTQSRQTQNGQVPDSALKEYRSLIEQGDRLFAQGKTDEALDLFQRAFGKNPNHWMAHHRIGNSYAALGRTDQAIRAFEKANSLFETALSHTNLAFLYLDKGDKTKSLSHARRAAEMEPTIWQPHYELGQVYRRLGQLDDAIASYRKANSLQERAEIHVGLGWTYLDKSNYDESIRSFERAAQLNPNELSTLCEARAWIHEKNGRLDQAIDSMRQAIEAAQNEQKKTTLTEDLASLYLEKPDYPKVYDLIGRKNRVGIQIANEDTAGIRVVKVIKNGPADLAGIQTGDVVVEFDGRPLAGIDSRKFVKEIVGGFPFGQAAGLKIDRQGQRLDKYMIVGITPDLPKLASAAIPLKQIAKPDLAATSSQAAVRQATIPVKQARGIQIAAVEVVPSQIAANGDFHIDIRFTASDPKGPADLPMTLSCAIYGQDKMLYQPPADSFKAPNGRGYDVRKKLSAGTQSGRYTIRVSLRGDGFSSEISAEFAIK
jgi:Flp pilus assembly protein TadD